MSQALVHAVDARKLIDQIAQTLVTVDHRTDGTFVATPLLYPSGTNVVVRVEIMPDAFYVTDMGFGYQEADMMGASLIYARHGRLIAEDAGVGFDAHSFFVLRASRDQLAGAIAAVANCSLEAVSVTAHKLSERKVANHAERLYERLKRVFDPATIAKDAEILGASNTTWEVANLVRTPNSLTIFEPVINHRNSVASVVTKFHDIKLLENAPARVAVVHRKDEFGTLLSVLVQAGSVVSQEISDNALRRLAKAA